MPRPRPQPEDEKVRTTISLPAKVVAVAEGYRTRHPEENLPDFSAVVARALIDYAARKHPDLLQECIRNIRDKAARGATTKSIAPLTGAGIPDSHSVVGSLHKAKKVQQSPPRAR